MQPHKNTKQTRCIEKELPPEVSVFKSNGLKVIVWQKNSHNHLKGLNNSEEYSYWSQSSQALLNSKVWSFSKL